MKLIIYTREIRSRVQGLSRLRLEGRIGTDHVTRSLTFAPRYLLTSFIPAAEAAAAAGLWFLCRLS